ncbi:MAG: glutamate mutase L [Chloroflexi bacterium]|nr:glutamate mutase L [Chloroflexota bacterium]
MRQDYAIESILVADCGSTTTRVFLMDIVGGEHRFLAKGESPTTLEPPFSDITVGIRNALESIKEITGREFMADEHLIVPQTNAGDGVDLFLITSSAGRPLIVAAAEVAHEGAAALARAVRTTYASVGHFLQLEDAARANGSDWAEVQVDRLLRLQPDVVVIAGGHDGESVEKIGELVRIVAAGLPEQDQTGTAKPEVIYAGNQNGREIARDYLEPRSALRLVDNIRPRKSEENIHAVKNQLREAYHNRILATLPGINLLGVGQDDILWSTADAEEWTARFLSKQYQRDVLTVDLGGSSTSLFLSSGNQFVSSVQPNFGLAYGLPRVLSIVGAENILRWLPFECDEEELADWAFAKLLRPFSMPVAPRQLAIEQAFAREALRYSFQALLEGIAAFPLDLVVGSGGVLTHAASPQQVALMLLDALQPTGETTGSVELAIDSTDLMAPVGAMSRYHPDGAANVFSKDALLWLGTVITPLGTAEIGETAVKVTAESEDGEFHKVEVPYGSLALVPLRLSQKARITVEPGRQFRIGGAEKGEAVKTSPGEEIRGGMVGLIVDARGRPIALPDDPAKRREKVQEWTTAMEGGNPILQRA